MDDKKLVEDLYSITKPWYVSKVILSSESLRLDAYLDHEKVLKWMCFSVLRVPLGNLSPE
jgi:hypothetical protein